jgi:hypothetical protein
MLDGWEGQQGICSLVEERRVVPLAHQEAQDYEPNRGWSKSSPAERRVEINITDFRGWLKKT